MPTRRRALLILAALVGLAILSLALALAMVLGLAATAAIAVTRVGAVLVRDFQLQAVP